MKKADAPKRAGRMSDAAVQAKTGKTWPEWFAALDRAGAAKLDHKGIVAHLKETHGLGPWWQQMVTVAYEQERGLRAKHQKPDGFEISSSRTIAVPVSELYRAWQDRKSRNRWLEAGDFVVRTARPDKSLRITWSDGKTNVEVQFYAKGDARSQVTVQHGKLADAAAASRMKAFWSDMLGRLKEVLER